MRPTSSRPARWVAGGVAATAIVVAVAAVAIRPSIPDTGSVDPPPAEPPAADTRPAPVPGPRALLVGVTKYDHLPGHDLAGPANDVELFARVLTERFQFPAGNIVKLAEAEGKPDLRPTRANIAREFRRLAETAAAGEQVVVLLSGHGSRQPEPDPPGPFPEPDGFDEVFLPADTRPWTNAQDRLPGALVDDEIGAWLKAITDKKAYVWAVFDCCHSQSIDRAAVFREIEPGELIPARERAAAGERAKARARRENPKEARFVRPEPDPYLVATYACRAAEATPEEPLPRRSRDAVWHGLLTYSVCEVLTQAAVPLTYKELIQRVQVQYTRRPGASPTPTLGGTGQDREVLGVERWPGRSDILLRKADAAYTVTAGELHGLTPGSILAVNGPAGTASARTRLGHVKVARVTPITAEVESVAFADQPAPAGLPDLAVCKVAFTDYGAGRFRLAVDIADQSERAAILAAIDPLTHPKTGVVEVVDDPRRADWVVGIRDGRPVIHEGLIRKTGGPEVTGRPPFVLRPFRDQADREEVAAGLEQMYRARALLAVAARAEAESTSGAAAILLEVEAFRHTGKETPDAEPARAADGEVRLTDGDWVSYRVRNRSKVTVDVTLLLVGTDYRIATFYPLRPGDKATLAPGEALVTARGDVGPPFGPEQLVAIAVPAQNPPVDFGILAQPGLAARRGGDRSKALSTPIGQLMESSIYRVGGKRGLSWAEADPEMGIRVLTWRTMPASPPGK